MHECQSSIREGECVDSKNIIIVKIVIKVFGKISHLDTGTIFFLGFPSSSHLIT